MRILASLLGLFVTMTALAMEPAGLAPYRADYQLSYGPMGMANAEYHLARQADGSWLFQSSAKAVGMAAIAFGDELTEQSRFKLDGQTLLPLHYELKRASGAQIKEAERIDFDWQGHQAIAHTRKGKQVQLTIHPGVLDQMLMQLALRQQLLAGKERMSIDFIDEDEIKNYEFAVTGRERIKTAAGEFDTVRVARTDDQKKATVFWFAPKLDYLPVRLDQTKRKRPTLHLELKAYHPGAAKPWAG